MNQARTAEKIIRDLLELGIIKDEHQEITYKFLLLAYGSGFDAGRSQNKHRKAVMRCDIRTEKPIEIYDSITIAARKMKTSYSNITEALRDGRNTAVGFIWKLVDLNKNGEIQDGSFGN